MDIWEVLGLALVPLGFVLCAQRDYAQAYPGDGDLACSVRFACSSAVEVVVLAPAALFYRPRHVYAICGCESGAGEQHPPAS